MCFWLLSQLENAHFKLILKKKLEVISEYLGQLAG